MAITVTQLTAFLAVVRTGSVTDAAQELQVTQPSVSAAVAALSRELGCEVLERDGRGIRPTAAGREFAGYASDVIGLLEAGRRAATEASERAAREVRLAVSTTAAETFVPQLVRDHAQRHPHVEVRLTVANPEEAVDAVLEHAVDLAIVGRFVHDSRLVAVPILQTPVVCVTAPDEAWAAANAVDVESLSGRVWLLREQGSSTRLLSEQFLFEQGIDPQTLTLGSNAAIKQAVLAGLGVALLPFDVVERELSSGRLAQVSLVCAPAPQAWHLVRSSVGPLRDAVAGFVDFSSRLAIAPR